MKQVFKTIILSIFFVHTAFSTEITKEDYQNDVNQLIALYHSLGVGEFIRQVDNEFTKIIDETITESHTDNASDTRAGFVVTGYQKTDTGASIKGIPFFIHTTKKKSWDLTQMIVRNPKAESLFAAKVDEDYRKLQQELVNYIGDNQKEIIRLKSLAANALYKAHILMQNGAVFTESDINSIAEMALKLNFLGKQTVTSCVQTNRIDRTHTETHKSTLKVLGFEIPMSGTNKKWEQIAHSTTECESEINSISVDVEQTVYKLNLSQIDQLVAEWAYIAFQQASPNGKEPTFKTFGSPYYHQ